MDKRDGRMMERLIALRWKLSFDHSYIGADVLAAVLKREL
jgi:hypothetical protein